MASCCASGPGQQHAEIQRVQKARLADPSFFLDQLGLHDRDLPGRPAERDEAKLQPKTKRFGKGWVTVCRRSSVSACLSSRLHRR